MNTKTKTKTAGKKTAAKKAHIKPAPGKFYVTKNGSVIMTHNVARTFLGGEKSDPKWEDGNARAVVISGGHGLYSYYGFAPGSCFTLNAKTGRGGSVDDDKETTKKMDALSIVRLAVAGDLLR